MNEKTSKPFGLWPSPVTPASLAQGTRLSDVQWDDDGEQLVWLEGRSDQGVLVCAPLGQAPRDLTPTRSVRARVGYGGGDFSVGGEHVYYVAQEGRIYRQPLAGGEARPVTPQFGHMAGMNCIRQSGGPSECSRSSGSSSETGRFSTASGFLFEQAAAGPHGCQYRYLSNPALSAGRMGLATGAAALHRVCDHVPDGGALRTSALEAAAAGTR